ncbi:MFS transporter [Frankia sp. CNm7]|uniref:MFS transporter n=1 Tax=Frankia nepalensis TaxID=1836974 RepID=A0A937R9J9_9ACTN|nr:MFS transporter [Frankia nepalensis]MBL7513540.1 MFS transporter [Frankia nepalensis]MBL7524896.1 MFS transporter [Frankia nepalensis]MBL7628173.1 MFS transporter [Frankia nepalensis]
MAAATLVLTFLASGTPIPLYSTYRLEEGISNSGLALTTVIYFAMTALSLLLLGRLSNHLGRRPVGIAALLSSIAGGLALMHVTTLPTLITGRVLQGVACGVASSALGSYVIETAPEAPRWLAALITSIVPPLAVPLGALLSGAIVEYGPAPRQLTYTIMICALALGVALLLACPETVERDPRAAARGLRPQVRVPAGAGRPLFVAGLVAVATWSLGGFFQAFAPGLTADRLGTDNTFVVALVFASLSVLSPVGGALTGQLGPATAVRLGLGVFATCAVVVTLAVRAGAIVPFLVASFVAGVGQGVASAGGMRGLLARTGADDRAGALSAVFLISYCGAAVPGLVTSRLAGHVSLVNITVGYAVLVVLASALAILAGRAPGPRAEPTADGVPVGEA